MFSFHREPRAISFDPVPLCETLLLDCLEDLHKLSGVWNLLMHFVDKLSICVARILIFSFVNVVRFNDLMAPSNGDGLAAQGKTNDVARPKHCASHNIRTNRRALSHLSW